MNIHKKWSCRDCHVSFRHQVVKAPSKDMSPASFLASIIKECKNDVTIHICSGKIAGIADFAGVEFSEE